MAINYESFYDSLFGGHGILHFHTFPEEDELEREMQLHELINSTKRRNKPKTKKKKYKHTMTTLYATDSYEEDVMAFEAVTSFTCLSGPTPTTARVVDYLNDLKEQQVYVEVVTCHFDNYEIITPFVKKAGTSSQIITEPDFGYWVDQNQQQRIIGDFEDLMRLQENRINHKHYVRFKLRGPASYSLAVKLHRIFKRAVFPTLYTGDFGTKVKIRRIGFDSA